MYVGIDVHKDFCQACFLDAKGKVVKESVFQNTEDGLQKLAKAVRRSKVVFEASSSAFRIFDVLSQVCDVKVAHPLKVKAIASARIKTDKIDAHILAQLLRADLIPESYIPSREQRQVRIIVRHRVALGRTATRIKNQIHSILTREGIKTPYKNAFSKKGIEFLKNVNLEEMHRISLNSLLAILDSIEEQLKDTKERVEEIASKDTCATLLATHIGVGHLTALAVSSEIIDIERFPSHKNFCSYLGIVPSIHQSGNVERKGRITKQGNKLLRWLLVQCARSAVRHSMRFRKKYRSLIKKGVTENKAIVAIARIIAVDMYFMLVRNEPYREQGRKT